MNISTLKHSLRGKMKSTSGTCTDVLGNLVVENDHMKRFEILKEHINKFIDGAMTWDAMYQFTPVLIVAYENILEKNNQVAKNTDYIGEPGKLNEVVDNLHILSKYLGTLCILSEYFISKDEVSIDAVKDFPVCLLEVIRLTFVHCQDSLALYKHNENPSNTKVITDNLKNIYKTASELHAKLIQILIQYSTYNTGKESELVLLNDVLNAMVNVSATLMNIDFRLCADTWNSFLVLLKKYSEKLYGLFCFDKPFLVLMTFSINGLENINRDYHTISNESECSAQLIKKTVLRFREHRFIIRVIMKIYEKISLRNSDCTLFWIYFMQLFRFSKPIMVLKQSNQKLIDLMNEYIFEAVEPLFCAIICGFKFQSISNPSNELLEASIKSKSGFLLMINSILISTNIALNKNDVVDILQITFSAIKHCKCNDFFQNKIVIYSDDGCHDLYSELLVNLTCYILTLPKHKYAIAEAMIITNIFSEYTWLAVFAFDLLALLIRHTTPLYCYDIICDVIDRSLYLISATHTDTTDQHRLSSLLRMLFSEGPLDDTMRVKLLTKYPLPSTPCPWRHLGLFPLPKSRAFVHGMMLDYAEKALDEFRKGKMTGVQGFSQMMHYIEIVSSIPYNSSSPSDRLKIATLIGKLWVFNDNTKVFQHPLFGTYLTVSIRLTVKNLESLDGSQIMKIMSKIMAITAAGPNNDKFKLLAINFTSQCINMLPTKKDDIISDALFQPSTSTVAQLLNGIFPDDYDNDMVKREALAAIEYADKSILRDCIREFGRGADISNGVTHLNALYLENIRFGSAMELLQHKCIDWSAVADNGVCPLPGPSSSSVGCGVVAGIGRDVPLPPRDKDIRDQMDDVTKALGCIRNDLQVLRTYHKTFKFSQKNVSGIFDIIDDLKRLV